MKPKINSELLQTLLSSHRKTGPGEATRSVPIRYAPPSQQSRALPAAAPTSQLASPLYMSSTPEVPGQIPSQLGEQVQRKAKTAVYHTS